MVQRAWRDLAAQTIGPAWHAGSKFGHHLQMHLRVRGELEWSALCHVWWSDREPCTIPRAHTGTRAVLVEADACAIDRYAKHHIQPTAHGALCSTTPHSHRLLMGPVPCECLDIQKQHWTMWVTTTYSRRLCNITPPNVEGTRLPCL